MIKVSFKALGLLITYCWLYDESQGGSWLKTPPFLIASLEVIRLNSSHWKTDQLVTEGHRGDIGGLSSLITAGWKQAADLSWTRCFHHDAKDWQQPHLLSFMSHIHTDYRLFEVCFRITLKVGITTRRCGSNEILTYNHIHYSSSIQWAGSCVSMYHIKPNTINPVCLWGLHMCLSEPVPQKMHHLSAWRYVSTISQSSSKRIWIWTPECFKGFFAIRILVKS